MIPTHEDEDNEFKERPSGLEREIAAFANHRGGRIFIGVKDDGSICGFKLNNRNRSQIVQALTACEPAPDFSLEQVDDYVVLTIEEGSDKPYRAPNGFYLRIGPNSQKLSRDQIIKSFLKEGHLRFDSQVVLTKKELRDGDPLSFELIQSYADLAGLSGKLSHRALLSNLGLIKEKGEHFQITSAAVLLFCQDPQTYFPSARVLLWLMRSAHEILDHEEIGGDLINQLRESVLYVKKHTKTRFEIKGLQRTEVPEFSDAVLRELILNGLIHRDYFESGAELQIKIFPDKIEFANPALLPSGVEPSMLIGRSFRSNPALAEAFQRVGYIERAGTGLLRVSDYVQKNYSRALSVKIQGPFLVVTVPRADSIQDQFKGLDGISPRQRSIISLLSQEGELRSVEISKFLSQPQRTTAADLSELVSKDLVERIRVGRKVFYQLVQ